jgi:transcriptional regulator of acetoin/glycerol metabolism
VGSQEEYLCVGVFPESITDAVNAEMEDDADIEKLIHLKKEHLEKILNQFFGKIELASKFLGVSGLSLWRRAKILGVDL